MIKQSRFESFLNFLKVFRQFLAGQVFIWICQKVDSQVFVKNQESRKRRATKRKKQKVSKMKE